LTGVAIRHYPRERFSADFYRVVDFLLRRGASGFNRNWHWARWEWLMGHSNLDLDSLPKIGLFERGHEIVGIATHDMRMGKAYLLCGHDDEALKRDMLAYAEANLSHDGVSGIYIDDRDAVLIGLARERGFTLGVEREHVLALDCSNGTFAYDLCCDYAITDYTASKDLNKYYRVIWKGFDHEGLPAHITRDDVIDMPHEIPELAVFVVAPDGEYAAHCGTWYNPKTRAAYVEPVVTIPEYRRRGLGRAVVYESINRCVGMGAKTALVISNQDFYHALGFRECSAHSLWERAE